MNFIKTLKCLLGFHKYREMPHQLNMEWCGWCLKMRRVKK